MIPVLLTLIQNAALLLAMMVVFDLLTSRKAVHGQWGRQTLAGVILGGLCINLMLASFKLETGIIFDTRSVLLSLSGLFLGPIPTILAMAMAAAYRLWHGGTGVWTGIWVILATGGIGILWRHYRQGRLEAISVRELYGFGVVAHLVMLALMLTLPWEAARRVIGGIGLPVLLVYPIATIALGWLLANRLQRENTTEALAASETRYRSIFEAANVGKSLTLPTGEIHANRAFCDILGYTPDELRGKTWQELTPPEEIDQINDLLAPLMCGVKSDVQFEKRYFHKNGSHVWSDVSATIQRDRDGNPLHFIVTMVDITERKQAETESEKLQAQLLQARKMESVGRLAGGVAHDFNNMLGVILGHTELALLQSDKNHDLHAELKEIQTAAQRSADITKQLLAFARKQSISPRQIDLNDTVESMLNMLRRLIGEDIDLAWHPSAHLWPVKMDPSQIDQILANLCLNARDAIAGVGSLIIETEKKSFDEAYCSEHPGFIPADFVMLTVSDNGCGMDKNTLDNLFDPFFTTKKVGKGTGLGLATVYGIVKQNNGFINVYSEPGQGSTFKIYLPRLVTDTDAAAVLPEKKNVAGGTEVILLVEDELSILRMTRKMLERTGYTVISASTPAEAVEKAKNHSGDIDLLMTDVIMPEMNGRDLSEQITDLYPGIRLLFMSGYTANVIAHRGILEKWVSFIQKPFSMADLAEKIREVLDTTISDNIEK